MILRPRDQGASYEVFMLRRSAKSAFAPDVFVFPGGTLEQADMSDAMLARTYGIEPLHLQMMFRTQPTPSLTESVKELSEKERAGLVVAALRELYEEAGVLLTAYPNGDPTAANFFQLNAQHVHDGRERVRGGSTPFFALLEELEIYADGRPLTLFSQWITPPSEARRYNAHFFLAQVSGDQAALADTFETHDGVWIGPQTALDRNAQGSFAMVFPTIKHIERLARHRSLEELMRFAHSKPIVRIMPHITGAEGFALPKELEFMW